MQSSHSVVPVNSSVSLALLVLRMLLLNLVVNLVFANHVTRQRICLLSKFLENASENLESKNDILHLFPKKHIVVETVRQCLQVAARMLGFFQSSRTGWTHLSSSVCTRTGYHTSTSTSSWSRPKHLRWYWCVHHCQDQQSSCSDSPIDGCILADWVVCTEWIDQSRW